MAQGKDIVLISLEDKPIFFARIESILQDSKPNWYHVKLLLLKVPLQVVTWILRDIYIDGAEFTMDGKKMQMQLVECPKDEKDAFEESKTKNKTEQKNAKVISLMDRKKNR